MKQQNKYTFFGVLNTWTRQLVHIAAQWRIFAVYAAVITVISALFGRWSYACQHGISGYWCLSLPANKYLIITCLVVFYALLLYLIGAFITDLHNSLFKNSVFKPKDVLVLSRQKMASARMLLTIMLLAVSCTMAAVYIIRRPANPDFGIEFCWFIAAFMLILVPLLMVRCSACFAYYLNTGRLQLRKVFDYTGGRSYISVMLFLLLMIILLMVNLHAIAFFNRMMQNYNYLATAVVTDFADCLLKLICLAMILAFFDAQYIRMEETAELRETPVVAANENDDEKEADIAPKMTAKASNKKKNKRKAQNSETKKATRKKNK